MFVCCEVQTPITCQHILTTIRTDALEMRARGSFLSSAPVMDNVRPSWSSCRWGLSSLSSEKLQRRKGWTRFSGNFRQVLSWKHTRDLFPILHLPLKNIKKGPSVCYCHDSGMNSTVTQTSALCQLKGRRSIDLVYPHSHRLDRIMVILSGQQRTFPIAESVPSIFMVTSHETRTQQEIIVQNS